MGQELKNEMEEIDNVEVEPLADGELEDVAGGVAPADSCSTFACSH